MPSITQPSVTRPLAVSISQPLRLQADVATDWWVRNQSGANTWSQINMSGTTDAVVWETPSSLTNSDSFDRVQIVVNTGSAPGAGETGGLHLNVVAGPVAGLLITSQAPNQAMGEPPLDPDAVVHDDPPQGVPLYMPGANRDGLATQRIDEPLAGGGRANLAASYGPGLTVDTAGKLTVRTSFTNRVRGLGPFPAIASFHHSDANTPIDFGRGRTLGLTRRLFADTDDATDDVVAVLRGDGRRATYRATGGGSYEAAAGQHSDLVKSGGDFVETSPGGVEYHFDSAGALQKVVSRYSQAVYYRYDADSRLQKIEGLTGSESGLVPYLSYDGSGRLTRLVLEDGTTPANNRTTYFAYDGNDDLIEIIGPEGCTTDFSYDGSGRVTAVTDAAPSSWNPAYDGNGRVEKIQDGEDQTAYFAFDVSEALATMVDRAGKATYMAFDAFGAPTAVFNVGTPGDYYVYDGEGNLLQSTNRLGNTWSYEYDAQGNRISATDPLGARSYFAYDGQNLLRTYIAPSDTSTYLDWDASRNLIEREDAVGNLTTWGHHATGLTYFRRDRRGNHTYFFWDGQGNLERARDALGQETLFEFNSAGERVTAADALGQPTYMAYDLRGRVEEVKDARGAIRSMEYDARCNMVSETDPLNHTTEHVYDGNSNRIKSTDPEGNATYFTFDAEDRLETQTDALFQTTTWCYDALGRQDRQTDDLGGQTDFVYDDAHQLERQLDPNDNASYFGYDVTGRRTHQKNALLQETYFGFDLDGSRVLSVDALGRPTYFRFDALDRLTETENAIGATSETSYDAEGNRLTSTDPRGNVTTFVYDELGRLEKSVVPSGLISYHAYDAVSNLTSRTLDPGAGEGEISTQTYSYDVTHRQVAAIDACGLRTYHAYDLAGNMVQSSQEEGWGYQPWGNSPYGGLCATTYFGYDDANRRTTTTDAYGNVSTTVYDRASNVTRSVDPLGFATYFEHDALNRRVKTKDGVHFAETYMGYDAAGNVVLQLDQEGNATYFTFDALNRQSFVHDAAGALTYSSFDAVGNLEETKVLLGAGGEERVTSTTFDVINRRTHVTDAEGGVSYMGYDVGNNVVLRLDQEDRPTYFGFDTSNRQETRKNGLMNVWETDYDAHSNVVRQIDPVGRTSYFGYDAMQRRVSQGNALGEVSTTGYDARGNRTVMVNPRGYATYYRHDLLGRSTHVVDALGSQTYMGFDAVGNRILQLDELENPTYMAYDGLRRLTHVTDAAGAVTYFGHDARSKLVLKVQAEGGEATYFAYDAVGRLEGQTFTTDSPIGFAYDEVGNLLAVEDDTIDTANYFVFDKLNRLVKKTTRAGAVYYAFDASGMRTSLKDPALNESLYVYDDAGQVSKIQLAAGRTAYFAHDAAGLPTRKIAPGNGNMAYFAYDDAGRLESLQNRHLVYPIVITSFDYTRDANGQITRIDHEQGQSTYFAYDALDRLTSEKRLTSGSTTFAYEQEHAYDAASNRTRWFDFKTPGYFYYDHDSRNLIVQEHDLVGETSYFTWDASQRLLAKRVTGSEQSSYFTHDQRDQVTAIDFAKASAPDTNRGYRYTGWGERVIADAATPTYLAYDSGKLLREVETSGVPVATYRHNVSALDMRGSAIEFENSGGIYAFGFDDQGTQANVNGGIEQNDKRVFNRTGNLVGEQTVMGTSPRMSWLSPHLLGLALANDRLYVFGRAGGVWLSPQASPSGAREVPRFWDQMVIASPQARSPRFFAQESGAGLLRDPVRAPAEEVLREEIRRALKLEGTEGWIRGCKLELRCRADSEVERYVGNVHCALLLWDWRKPNFVKVYEGENVRRGRALTGQQGARAAVAGETRLGAIAEYVSADVIEAQYPKSDSLYLTCGACDPYTGPRLDRVVAAIRAADMRYELLFNNSSSAARLMWDNGCPFGPSDPARSAVGWSDSKIHSWYLPTVIVGSDLHTIPEEEWTERKRVHDALSGLRR